MKFLELGWPRVEFSRASRIANTRQLEVPSYQEVVVTLAKEQSTTTANVTDSW